MRHFTLLLLSVFTVYQAKADILIPLDKYPTGEKRFNLQINGSHDTSTPWLSTTSFGVDEDGQMGNPENWTSEQIDEDNHSVSHRLIMNIFPCASPIVYGTISACGQASVPPTSPTRRLSEMMTT